MTDGQQHTGRYNIYNGPTESGGGGKSDRQTMEQMPQSSSMYSL